MEFKGFHRKLTAILSADVAGYSRLMQDDEAAPVKTLESYKRKFSLMNLTEYVNALHGHKSVSDFTLSKQTLWSTKRRAKLGEPGLRSKLGRYEITPTL